MYEEELAYGLGGLLRSHGNVHQLIQGMMGIIADYAHANRMMNIEGRTRALFEEFTAAPDATPPQKMQQEPQPLRVDPRSQVTDQEYSARLRTAMSRAASEPPPPVPNGHDPDPYRIYTRGVAR